MRVALTGTPGVGKTTLARVAFGHGWEIVDVKAWAREKGCITGHDPRDQADVIDVVALAGHVLPDEGRRVLYEGHLSHLLPLDAAWVVRTDPLELRSRLTTRGYPESKVQENVEAEALDIILQEALAHIPRVVQRDGTRRSPEDLYKSFDEVDLKALKHPDLEPVDWVERL